MFALGRRLAPARLLNTRRAVFVDRDTTNPLGSDAISVATSAVRSYLRLAKSLAAKWVGAKLNRENSFRSFSGFKTAEHSCRSRIVRGKMGWGGVEPPTSSV